MNAPASAGAAVGVLPGAVAWAERARGSWRAAGVPLVLVLGSAWLLRIAVPPDPVAPVAWVALVPLALALRNRSPAGGALIGFVFGAASLAAMHTWFLRLPGANVFNVSALFGYLSLYPAVWCALLAWLMRGRLPWVFPGAVLWVLIDWLRGHAGPFALPWDPLAHSQIADLRLLQLAALGGAPLISLCVCLVNLALARAWLNRSLPALLATAIGVAALHVYGRLAIPATAGPAGTRIAVIQPADDNASPAARLERLRALTREAAKQAPDLIVWPESSIEGYAFSRTARAEVARVAREANAPILFGSGDFGKFAKHAGDGAEDVQFKNQAYLVFPDGTREGPYAKNRLVPFGEYMPFAGRVKWPHWLVGRQRDGIAGVEPGIFRLRNGTTLGVVVCWENLFADLADRLVLRHASMVVQLSDDSDFGASSEPAQHNAASVLRAVEDGRDWVQASASGPSILVDAHGSIIDSLGPMGASGWTVRTLSGVDTTTVYQRLGLVWLWFAAAAASIWVVLRWMRERRKRYAHREAA